MKKILITGAGGQDGILLARFLSEQGDSAIHAAARSELPHEFLSETYVGDLRDRQYLKALAKHQFDEIYHLGASTFAGRDGTSMSHIYESNILGTEVLLENVLRYSPETRVFVANSASIFGTPFESPQSETTVIDPQNAYAVSKAACLKIAQLYRDQGLFVSSGILYNHESTLRPLKFVVRKITHGVAAIVSGRATELTLGATDVVRDWGAAEDYVRGFVSVLRHDEADDFVLATGQGTSVQEICDWAFSIVGLKAKDYVKISDEFVRKREACSLIGDAGKAKRVLGWEATTEFSEVVKKMLQADLKLAGVQSAER